MQTATIDVAIPKAHPIQADFINSPAKRKVIVAGRRGGKTTGVAILAAKLALKEKRRILEAAPTQEQTDAFWETVKKYYADLLSSGLAKKNETRRLVDLPGGGRIRCKTAWDADTLRGDYADLLILDEFADMDTNAWDEVGAPMLLDNDGDAIFIGTPKRRNHFFRMYQTAIGDDTGRWQAWHFTSYDNPHLSKDALEEITADMTESAYQQEILAQFLEGEGAVFRNISGCLGAPDPADPHQGHRMVAGVDWAKQSDYTAISIGCLECRQEVARDRFNKIDFHFQRERLKALVSLYNLVTIRVELNSIGEPNFEELQRDGLPVVGFMTTASSKPQLIENLALVLEKGEWQFQPDPVWTGELEAYERKVSPTTGRSSYSAPEGVHDDTVIARALMVLNTGIPQPLPVGKELERKSTFTDYGDHADAGKWSKYG